jgi:peptide/nickel transport system ATP-binding protein
MTIKQIVGEPLRSGKNKQDQEYVDKIADMLLKSGLSADYMNRYPHAFSGGQRQRIGIARALITNPELVIADEPVSALDVSIQAQILNLLKELQESLGHTYIFIAHDLSVIRYMCDTIAIMYVGKIVEMGKRDDIFNSPGHPYTEGLLSIIPKANTKIKKKNIKLSGFVADAANLPSGCHFHPRCKYAEEICKIEQPELKSIRQGHKAACHFNLKLEGI